MYFHNTKEEEQSFLEEVQRINIETNGPAPSKWLLELAEIYAKAVYRAYNEGFQDAMQVCKERMVKV